MRTVFIKVYFFFSFCFFLKEGNGQVNLDSYITEGLENNLAIKQRHLSLDKALNALKVAKSMYLPSLSVDMTYTSASGGRMINLPVGDMLNPVYSTLNQLTQSQLFPQIENERINFLPRNYYDARVRAAMPIINTDIKHNRAVNEKMVVMQEADVEVYQRELVKEIKQAYYNYLATLDAVGIYQNTMLLSKEGKRVNERLLDAGSGLPAYVIRSNAEIADTEAKLTEAEQQVASARYYFNMLLNREADAQIEVHKVDQQLESQVTALQTEIDRREEIKVLTHQVEIQETLMKMHRQVFVPKLNAFVDVGAQAENMQFNRDAQYVMFGAQLTFPIFEGNRNKLKVKESQIAVAEAENRLAQVRQQLQLSANVAKNEAVATYKSYQSALQRVTAAETYHRLIQRGFSEGVNTYIETIDARSQMMAAQLARNLAAYKWLSALANLERETASYLLK